jgi:hypothetical protein
MRLTNNTKSTSRIGYVCKIDPSNPASFIYATASDTQVLGICGEAVPYRSECEIITGGVARVFVSANVTRGAIIRNRKPSDTISNGMANVARSGDAPYLQIGYATESGKGLIKCNLLFNYQYSDDDSITWTDITGKPSNLGYISQTEIDFGTTPVDEKTFTITDANISVSSEVMVQLAYVAPTGKEIDELEFDSFDFRAVAGAGSFTLYARSLEGLVADKFKINYAYS